MRRIIYDIETYPNVFTLSANIINSPLWWQFEISDWLDDSQKLMEWLNILATQQYDMVGFNNIGFDYPVIHHFMLMGGHCSASDLHEKAVDIIARQDTDKFSSVIYPSDRKIRQIDLFRIHHFDNKAKTTNLKAIEFNMRLDSVEDLPFPPNTVLKKADVQVLRDYNRADVEATAAFYRASVDAIHLREELSNRYGRDFTNHNDVKIGKEILQMRLESRGVVCYNYGQNGRTPRQTPRKEIRMADCIPSWVKFNYPGFNDILTRLKGSVITETKGAFDHMSTTVEGLDYYFGTGGLHASRSNEEFQSDDEWMIVDADVTSMYPSIAIVNGYYPEHLGEIFVKLYSDLKEERLTHKKGTPENAALKLALNGTFGASNDRYSIFYDPLFTMKITVGGQLMLAMLIDMLWRWVPECQIIQANTDGVTCYLPRRLKAKYDEVCRQWETLTKLDLEYVEYKQMFIADVNNYIAETTTGKIKRKGRYDYNPQWHQNASKLVVPKVAEKVLLERKPIRETLLNWPDKMDFMCRVKVPRSSRLVGTKNGAETTLPNMCRYYVAWGGYYLSKVMPPLAKKPGVYRKIGVESGRTVCVCNKIEDAILPINFDYYANEVEKLTDVF